MFDSFLRGDPAIPRAIHSAAESSRFGISVGRLELALADTTPAAVIVEAIEASPFELVVLRGPSTRSDLGAAFLDSGLVAWQCDTLLYFELDVSDEVRARETDAGWRHVGPGDGDRLERVVDEVFDEYSSHYTTNPFIDPAAARAGYCEWVLDSLSNPSRSVHLGTEQDGSATGFVMNAFENGHHEILLGGITAAARGKRMYSRLLDVAESDLVAREASRIYISTQVSNGTVIREWIRRGYRFRAGLSTFHVMRQPLPTLRYV